MKGQKGKLVNNDINEEDYDVARSSPGSEKETDMPPDVPPELPNAFVEEVDEESLQDTSQVLLTETEVQTEKLPCTEDLRDPNFNLPNESIQTNELPETGDFMDPKIGYKADESENSASVSLKEIATQLASLKNREEVPTSRFTLESLEDCLIGLKGKKRVVEDYNNEILTPQEAIVLREFEIKNKITLFNFFYKREDAHFFLT